ncbi:acyltransferase family protein [Bacillus sp. FJAT-27231]|uniref:acyltransferase family protein n=1 Tax=Bacillus sp. FJAT-27231 TaxID=1679168 RepID=UPI0006713810|nr:acyltransferase family protein [Bacillus sp. FJAT-27231]
MEKKRLDFIDQLKIALIMLVIVHHAGQAYGPGGWWYFQSAESIPWLGRFFTVNAAFFMSLFFFLSAYFVPASFARKGPRRFLIERFKRIGIPLLLGFFIMMPVLMYVYYIHFRGYEPISFFTYYSQIFFGFGEKPAHWTGPSWPDMQFGHLWFLEHLLVYTLLFVWWRKLVPMPREKQPPTIIHTWQIIFFLIILALVTFVIRIWFPIDRWIGFLGIIQAEFAHVPHYASFFFLGILAYERNWLFTFPRKTGFLWLAAGLVMTVILYFGGSFVFPYLTKGGWNIGSLAKSFVEAFLCISLIIGLVTLFREMRSRSNHLLKSMASNTFVVYFLHVPVVVALQYSLAALSLSVVSQFLLSSVLGIVFSFLISQFVWRRLPYLKNLM